MGDVFKLRPLFSSSIMRWSTLFFPLSFQKTGSVSIVQRSSFSLLINVIRLNLLFNFASRFLLLKGVFSSINCIFSEIISLGSKSVKILSLIVRFLLVLNLTSRKLHSVEIYLRCRILCRFSFWDTSYFPVYQNKWFRNPLNVDHLFPKYYNIEEPFQEAE